MPIPPRVQAALAAAATIASQRTQAVSAVVATRVPRWALVLAAAVAVLVLSLLNAVVVERVLSGGEVLAGVRLDGVEVAGVDAREARRRIAAHARRLERVALELEAGGAVEGVRPRSMALRVDDTATARAVLAAGRTRNPLAQVASLARRRLGSVEVPWRVTYDAAGLDAVVARVAGKVDRPADNGGLRFEGTRVERVQPEAGVRLDRAEARRLVTAALTDRRGRVRLPLRRAEPSVSPQAVEQAARGAERLLAEPIPVWVGQTTLTLTPEGLATALRAQSLPPLPLPRARPGGSTLALAIDPAALRAAFGQPLAALEQPPQDARLDLGPKVRIVRDQPGRILDAERVADQILAGHRPVVGGLRPARAEVTADELAGLGIREQVAAFTTPFPPGEPRVLNIRRAAEILQNQRIEPGEEFSLNQAIGPRTRQRGFVEAPIILRGEFEKGVGGGVSQIGTTFFNAVFRGGYKVLEFQPHTYWISRYPKGVEATLSTPKPDVRFVNDTRAHILVRTRVEAASVTITLYGDNEGRTVDLQVRTSNEKPAGVEQVTDPEDVAAPHDGFDVEFFRTIRQPGRPPVGQRYFHRYQVADAKVLE
jgi:vancomycin resistance protein YoaR